MTNKRLVLANFKVVVPEKDLTPIGVNLIPTLTSMSSANGVVTGNSPADSAYNIRTNSSATYELSNNAYRIFDTTNSGIVFEKKVYIGSDITYTLDSSQYNKGFFDPGTYRFFTSFYNRTMASDCYMNFIFYVKDEYDNWKYITTFGPVYQSTPYTATIDFTVDCKFKGIRMYKINTNNYDHTRSYQRYNTNLIRISK